METASNFKVLFPLKKKKIFTKLIGKYQIFSCQKVATMVLRLILIAIKNSSKKRPLARERERERERVYFINELTSF